MLLAPKLPMFKWLEIRAKPVCQDLCQCHRETHLLKSTFKGWWPQRPKFCVPVCKWPGHNRQAQLLFNLEKGDSLPLKAEVVMKDIGELSRQLGQTAGDNLESRASWNDDIQHQGFRHSVLLRKRIWEKVEIIKELVFISRLCVPVCTVHCLPDVSAPCCGPHGPLAQSRQHSLSQHCRQLLLYPQGKT